MKKILMIALIFLTTLTACEVSIKDGKVPADYIQAAEMYEGQYVGNIEGKQMNLYLNVADDGLATLKIEDLNGNKNFIANCSTEIGQLRYANIDKEDQVLKSAKFKLKTSCPIKGQYVELYFENTKQLNLEVLETTKMEYQYEGQNCFATSTGQVVCQPKYNWTEVPQSWITGQFQKN